MTRNPWPKVPKIDYPLVWDPQPSCWEYGGPQVLQETPLCKHKTGSCETCGTTIRRDTAHITAEGMGSVGVLMRRKARQQR